MCGGRQPALAVRCRVAAGCNSFQPATTEPSAVPHPYKVRDLLPRKPRLRLLVRGEADAPVHADATALGKVRCSTCHLRPSCLPAELTDSELRQVDSRLVTGVRKVAQGATLFRAGNRFDAVFQIWTGFFKTVSTTGQGREQVMGFQMAGDLLGFDGIGTGVHHVDAIALEDSRVCVISYADLQALGHDLPSLQEHRYQAMSREIVGDHRAMLRLGSMHAEERVAAFVISLSDRLHMRGFSASALVLRMGREEIGNYLGLTLETVSRTLSKLQASGLLFVNQRQIRITDPAGLQHLLGSATA
jgi:CRP/FNR family transcriptional regulator